MDKEKSNATSGICNSLSKWLQCFVGDKKSNRIYDANTIELEKLEGGLDIYNRNFRDACIKFFNEKNYTNILSSYVLAYIEPKKLKLFGLWDPIHWSIYNYTDNVEKFCKFLKCLYSLSFKYSEEAANYVSKFSEEEFPTFVYFPIYEFETNFNAQILLDSLAYSIACQKELSHGGICLLPKGHDGNHFSSNTLKEVKI